MPLAFVALLSLPAPSSPLLSSQSMLDDLNSIRQELLPDEKEKKAAEEMKTFDDFQRKKHALNTLLQDVRTDVERLNELRQRLGKDERDTTTIRLQSDNSDRLKEAYELFNELKAQLAKDAEKTGRKKIDEKELADRRHLIILLGEDIKDLSTQNGRVRLATGDDEELVQGRIARRQAKDSEAKERRERSRKNRRLKKGESGIDEDDFQSVAGPSNDMEMAFEEKVQANMHEQDQMLAQISAGLDELKELAQEASKQLTIQKAMLDQVDDKMDTTMRQFKTANARLKSLLEESGGMSRWCPILLIAVVVLALVGYIFHIGGV